MVETRYCKPSDIHWAKPFLYILATGGCPHGNPLLMVIETNGGRTGKFVVIYIYLSMKLRPLETVKSIYIIVKQVTI
jgi:hypothetical protein